jgi:hypothetical protein
MMSILPFCSYSNSCKGAPQRALELLFFFPKSNGERVGVPYQTVPCEWRALTQALLPDTCTQKPGKKKEKEKRQKKCLF